MKLLMQCPGCWSVVESEKPQGGWLECDCGEKLTVIDLRHGGTGDAPLTVDRGNLSHAVRRIPLPSEPPVQIVIAGEVYVPKEVAAVSFDAPMHTLASTIGRARVATDPGPIRTDLDDAATAIGELRELLAAQPSSRDEEVRDGAEEQRLRDLLATRLKVGERLYESVQTLLAHATDLENQLVSVGAEAMARKEYELQQEELGREEVWEEESQGHRNIYLDAAKARLGIALAALADNSPETTSGGER